MSALPSTIRSLNVRSSNCLLADMVIQPERERKRKREIGWTVTFKFNIGDRGGWGRAEPLSSSSASPTSQRLVLAPSFFHSRVLTRAQALICNSHNSWTSYLDWFSLNMFIPGNTNIKSFQATLTQSRCMALPWYVAMETSAATTRHDSSICSYGAHRKSISPRHTKTPLCSVELY